MCSHATGERLECDRMRAHGGGLLRHTELLQKLAEAHHCTPNRNVTIADTGGGIRVVLVLILV